MALVFKVYLGNRRSVMPVAAQGILGNPAAPKARKSPTLKGLGFRVTTYGLMLLYRDIRKDWKTH